MSDSDSLGSNPIDADHPATAPDEASSEKPLDIDGVNAVVAGTVAFAFAFVVLLFFRKPLQDNGSTWWLWTCLVGTGLGLVGTAYVVKRRAVYRGTSAKNP